MDAQKVQESLNKAIKLQQTGKNQQARAICEKIIAIAPQNTQALLVMGMSFLQDAPEQGIFYLDKAMKLKKDDPSVLCNRATLLSALNRCQESEKDFQMALKLAPRSSHIYNNLGNLYKKLQRFQEAANCYHQAILYDKNCYSALKNLGAIQQEHGQYRQAAVHLKQALARKPDVPDVLHRLAIALKNLRQEKEALVCLEKVRELEPDNPQVYCNLGNTYVNMHEFDKAFEQYAIAEKIKPDNYSLYSNRGFAYQSQGDYAKALQCYEKALSLNPKDADAHFNRSLTLLLLGRFDEGWREYEWRWKNKKFPNLYYKIPQWKGENLAGKRILIAIEQGFGDCINFCRYAPLLKDKGAYVILETHEALNRLMESLPGVDDIMVRDKNTQPPSVDYQVPLLALPQRFGKGIEDIPQNIPYLSTNEAESVVGKKKLSVGEGMKIGLVWAGNPSHKRDRCRSITLEQFYPLFELPDTQFFSLQKGKQASELNTCAYPVIDLAVGIENFADTAAIISQLDLVICVDTAVAHLAGALGVPVWVALHMVPDWRWLLERRDTPWYPSMQLFRQHEFDSWEGVIQEMLEKLYERLHR